MKHLILLTLIFAIPNTQAQDSLILEDSNIIFDTDEGSKRVPPKKTRLSNFCSLINQKYEGYEWGDSNCGKTDWLNVRNSFLGHPLVWFKSGKEKNKTQEEVILFACGLYGNEENVVKFCFDLIEKLKTKKYEDKFFVIAPLVNPDSFFKRKTKRTNQKAIDLLRNYPHKDWKSAETHWKKTYKKNPLFNPGPYPRSEKESVFLSNLAKRYRPMKLVVITHEQDYARGDFKKNTLSAIFKRELDMDFLLGPYFPGSLGSWAENENMITYSLFLDEEDIEDWAENTQKVEKLLGLI